jgi:protein TonB
MARSIGQGSGAATSRRFAWSLTSSSTVHGTVLGIASLLGGWWVAVDAADHSEPAAQAVTAPLVLLARADFDEIVEAEPEITAAEPELDDSELIETPLADTPSSPPVEREVQNPLAQATLVTRELLWQVDPGEPVEHEPLPTELAQPAEKLPTEVEIALEAEPAIVEAMVLEAPAPRYPRLSVRGGEEGTVACRLFVSEQGRVTRVEVLESSGHARLDEAAIEALLEWRFTPKQEGGRPVATTIRHPVTFVLETG